MVAEVETQDENGKFLEGLELVQELKSGLVVATPEQVAAREAREAAKSTTPVKKPLTLDHLRKRNAEKPLIKVEVSGLSDNETLICWRRDNIPASVVEDFRKKGEDRDLLKTVLDVVSTFVLNEQGEPLGTREEWAQFDIDTLNTILSALFESSNKVGEA